MATSEEFWSELFSLVMIIHVASQTKNEAETKNETQAKKTRTKNLQSVSVAAVTPLSNFGMVLINECNNTKLEETKKEKSFLNITFPPHDFEQSLYI